MAFGQSSGPPATGKQVRELLELLAAAGHSDFRDARGPMGFTQRQAGGKFTRDEADAFIERLDSEVDREQPSASTRPLPSTRAVAPTASKIAPRSTVTDSSSPASTIESVRLDREIRRQLTERAERDGTSISDVISEALRRYL